MWIKKEGEEVNLRERGRLLKAWLGGPGRPVRQEVAERRAVTCLRCPRHSVEAVEAVSKPAATALKRIMELKAGMGLQVKREKELHSCGICLCWMPTKVWCDLEFAREVTPDWQGFPAWCWLHGGCE